MALLQENQTFYPSNKLYIKIYGHFIFSVIFCIWALKFNKIKILKMLSKKTEVCLKLVEHCYRDISCNYQQQYFRHTNLHNSISSQHRRDNTMAALLSGIVVVFILCHSTKGRIPLKRRISFQEQREFEFFLLFSKKNS